MPRKRPFTGYPACGEGGEGRGEKRGSWGRKGEGGRGGERGEGGHWVSGWVGGGGGSDGALHEGVCSATRMLATGSGSETRRETNPGRLCHPTPP